MLSTFSTRRCGLVALTLAFSLAAILAACGGGSSQKAVAVDTWVANLCTSAKKFQATTDAAGAPVIALPDNADPAVAKKTWQDALGKVATADKDFRADYEKLGKPDLASGKAVLDAFGAEFDANDKRVADARTAIDRLDTTSKTFNADLTATASKFLAPGDFRAKLAAVSGSQPVADAIDKDPDCAKTIFSSDDTASNGGGSAPPAAISPTAARAQATSGATTTTGGSTNEKWTRGLCNATQSWSDDITKLAGGVDENKLDDPATAKDTLVNFLSAARDRTQKFKGAVDSLGNPDGKDGKAIEQAFSDGAAQAVKVFDDAVTSAKNLNASDKTDLENQISDLGDQLDKASNDLNDTFSSIDTKYDTTELTQIGQDLPECAGLF